MRRRDFIKVIGGAAAAWPLAAHAQQPDRIRLIGVLMGFAESDPIAQSRLVAFRDALAKLGWTEGSNLRIELRWGADDPDRMRTFAKDLVDLRPDTILSHSLLGTASVQRESRTIPIVFVSVSDPIGSGFVASLARPGGNLTGLTGARLDEICNLRAADVVEHKDGWWLKISEGKTQAAVREVPIHDSAAHVVKSRRKTSDGFLFPGLAPGGPDGKRSWNVSKAFGRYCTKLGLSDKALVFHSLRRTFTEALEAAEVPETTTKLLIGHARSSQTYGDYSKGERVNLREAICKLKYSPAVMVDIRRGEAVQKKPRRGARQQ
jgi:hypothetical protein